MKSGLVVESQEVVLIKASAADGWSAFETTMRAMPVVVVQPGKKPGITLLGVEIGAGVDPLAESSLDESFGLTVGAGSVRTSEVMTQSELQDSGAESMGAITMAVIGKQAANGDTESGVVIHGSKEKGYRIRGGEGGQDLGKGDAGMVIDGDVKILPAAMMVATTAAVGTNLDFGKAAQLLDIEVEQIARSGMFITLDGNGRLQIAHAVQAKAAENAAHGGPAQTGELGNVKAGEALSPQLFHALCQRFSGATG
jgi:hypothetical protein